MDKAWALLNRGAQDKKHPCNTPILITWKKETGPSFRSVILREASTDENFLSFHTDIRSDKVHQLKENQYAGWHFWSKKDNTQLRVSSAAKIHHLDATAEERFKAQSPSSLKIYLAPERPGTEKNVYTPNMPERFLGKLPSREEVQEGFQNFAWIKCAVTELEVLVLNREGHKRARFIVEPGKVSGTWLAP